MGFVALLPEATGSYTDEATGSDKLHRCKEIDTITTTCSANTPRGPRSVIDPRQSQ